jgi:hypothetical protein
VNGQRFNKPFVEKPVSGEDHNIRIYYPRSAGGGAQQLFRKIGSKSSQFQSDVLTVRGQGDFIYEDFLPTEGTDVKVYTVGANYAFAEARKSPTVDGVVARADDGKEIRYPVVLTPEEKDIARRVCLAFKQTVCGLDILRTEGRSYVCDVNGWSFVKKSPRYYDDCAILLREIILGELRPGLLRVRVRADPARLHAPRIRINEGYSSREPAYFHPLPTSQLAEDVEAADDMEGRESLRCVIAVIRHGDRTPKQKLKLPVCHPKFLQLFSQFGESDEVRRGQDELKLKTAKQLQAVLDVTRDLLAKEESVCTSLDPEEARQRLSLMKQVLERGGRFSGINRKVQLKPTSWRLPWELGGDQSCATSMKKSGDGQSGCAGATSMCGSDHGSCEVPGTRGMDAHRERGTNEAHEHSPPLTPSGRMDVSRAVTPLMFPQASIGGEPARPSGGSDEADVVAACQTALDRSLSVAAWAEPVQRTRSQVSHAHQRRSSISYEESGGRVVSEAVLVLKWGGELTQLGRHQALACGRNFRRMYAGSCDLLHLHSTYRHDMKVYSSDEGRVQMTAAAFAKGLLELDGELTPILVSLVHKGKAAVALLDDTSPARKRLESVKKQLAQCICERSVVDEEFLRKWAPCGGVSSESLRMLGSPLEGMEELHGFVTSFVDELRLLVLKEGPHWQWSNGETVSMALRRWEKLMKEMRKKGDGVQYDASKIPGE